MSELTHLDDNGRARMVDVGQKEITERVAIAQGSVIMQPKTLDLIVAGNMKKGDVLMIAQLAGVMGAKKTSDLIPLCHPLSLNQVTVTCIPNHENHCIDIEAVARVSGKTGVEMEALTAVSVCALTIYDMAKAVDREMQLSEIRLVYKSGGKSGKFQAEDYMLEE
ncbi:MAG: cyclic pyranopterin phosphate synthase [Cellvibrionaceae bacterium]|jgi:cyclic pyranopterin phosphate synthase